MHTHLPARGGCVSGGRARAAREAADAHARRVPPPAGRRRRRRLGCAAGIFISSPWAREGAASLPMAQWANRCGTVCSPTWARMGGVDRRCTPWAVLCALDGVPVPECAANESARARGRHRPRDRKGATHESDVAGVRLDLAPRANDIEADDTSSLVDSCRRRHPGLCPESYRVGAQLYVHRRRGEWAGRLVLWYTVDAIQRFVPDARFPTTTDHPRRGLLANLVDHVVDDVPLLVPAASTGAFMRVFEGVRTGTVLSPIDPSVLKLTGGRRGTAHRVVRDLEAWRTRASTPRAAPSPSWARHGAEAPTHTG